MLSHKHMEEVRRLVSHQLSTWTYSCFGAIIWISSQFVCLWGGSGDRIPIFCVISSVIYRNEYWLHDSILPLTLKHIYFVKAFIKMASFPHKLDEHKLLFVHKLLWVPYVHNLCTYVTFTVPVPMHCRTSLTGIAKVSSCKLINLRP